MNITDAFKKSVHISRPQVNGIITANQDMFHPGFYRLYKDNNGRIECYQYDLSYEDVLSDEWYPCVVAVIWEQMK